MMQNATNIFDQATQLVSLDCSTIQNMTLSSNLSQSNHISHNSLHQSLLNLKTVLPTFTSEFNLFKQQIIDMSYYIVNKLMSTIKQKNQQTTHLKNQLQKSLSLNNTMKNQVIQLKQMIAEFMENFKKQINQKDKFIKHKQQEITKKNQQIHQKNQQISLKINQINQLKNVLKLNFNSPRNTCQNCESKINNHHANIILNFLQNTRENQFNEKCIPKSVENNSSKDQQILIEMSNSILCYVGDSGQKLPLQVIQQESSDVNSITDCLQSQRYSQKQDTLKVSVQLLKSSRTNQESDLEKQNFHIPKKFNFTGKMKQNQLKISQDALKLSQNFDEDQTVKYRSPLGNIKIFTNFKLKKDNDAFSSRNNYKGNQNGSQHNNTQNQKQRERERRCSQQILISNSFLQVQNNNENSQETNTLTEKITVSQSNFIQVKQQLSLKAQLQQVSKSSSSSDIIHFGDTDKINVNLPKMFETPKNMNFVKKNSSRNQSKQQRLKTQPTPRNQKCSSNKQNINFQYQQKPIEMGKKIFARKKMIMTHAKPAITSRVESKPVKEEIKDLIMNKKYQSGMQPLKNNLIEIKCIQSPPKYSHVLKPSIPTIFSSEILQHSNLRTNKYMELSSNISSINESIVKSHHLYHSTGKYQTESASESSHKTSMTPGKHQNKTQQKRSVSKSKQKLKVTSKITQQSTSIHHLTSHKKQRFLTEINQNQLITNNQLISKLKNKNGSVHIGNSSKSYLRQKLLDIKKSLMNYSLNSFLTTLREVYFDGQIINGQKEGFGKVIYHNGMNYQGQFKNGKKTGNSKITFNGFDVFQGQFQNDQINGQGYLKFFRFFSHTNQCPKVLKDASYFGRFVGNNFDGMGTLFLNQKQKIVTKFRKGEPFGEVTFYSEKQIDFDVWPDN